MTGVGATSTLASIPRVRVTPIFENCPSNVLGLVVTTGEVLQQSAREVRFGKPPGFDELAAPR